MKSVSFPPIIASNCRILILGTMPGILSLKNHQYYAHPRNHFWPIMKKLFMPECPNDYKELINLLLDNNLGLWDTLWNCQRQGSADSGITEEIPNNINALLSKYSTIQHIAFNGQYAEKFYKKFNQKKQCISYYSLPSTSPANARYSYEQKLEKWQVLKELSMKT
jgi:hypoxanthine-DNA glycosylase